MKTRQHPHDAAFAGPVMAAESQHLAGRDREAGRADGLKPAIAQGHALDEQKGDRTRSFLAERAIFRDRLGGHAELRHHHRLLDLLAGQEPYRRIGAGLALRPGIGCRGSDHVTGLDRRDALGRAGWFR